jgi:hypothetical protein
VTCSDDTQCAGGFYCNGANCVAKKGLGTGCGRDGECGSTHCTEGVCCGAANCLPCWSCVVANSLGTCALVPPGGADPAGTCINQGAASCGMNGTCNGAGSCALYDMSTVCATSCASPDFTTTYCDGLGGCNQQMLMSCANGCDANGCLP